MTPRTHVRQRGLEIAATANIVRKGDVWSVPSQSLNGRYSVTKAGDELRCSCPDYELRGQTCKHGFAVEFVIRRETAPDGTVTETRAARVPTRRTGPLTTRRRPARRASSARF